MTTIITLANNKGGVAKTTTAFNLSKGLARHNKKVLLIDLDPQGNSTTLTGLDKEELTHTIADIFKDKNTDIKNLILQVDDIHIIPSNSTLQKASEELQAQAFSDIRLATKIKDIKDLYDFIIIDTPPSTNNLTRNGIIASDKIMIPIQAEHLALQGTADFIQFIDNLNQDIKELNQEPKRIDGALITMYDNRTKQSEDIKAQADEGLQAFNIKAYNTIIHRNTDISKAPSKNKSIYDYNLTSQGAKDYEDLTNEIIKGASYGEHQQ